MKKITILAAMLLVASFALAQQPDNSMVDYSTGTLGYVDVTYNNTDKDTIFFLFPNYGGTYYISETMPTATTAQVRNLKRYSAEGSAYVCFETNKTSGQEDSLAHWVKPLVWDPKDKEFAIIDKDSTFLVADTKETYTASSADYLDATTGQEYAMLLSGLLWPCAGFALIGRQADEGTAVEVVTYWLSLTR